MKHEIGKFTIKPKSKVSLKKIATSYSGKMTKVQANMELDELHNTMFDLQSKLHAEKKQSLLIVLQAMDAGGKDGTIRDVMHGFNPQGCRVEPFRTPNNVEKHHDFLWRIHKVVPPKGEITIFNRSHYGDVLVVRVRNLVPKKQWEKRYNHINDFERMLSDEGVKIVKLFLHIGKDEQKKRLDRRLDNPSKHWKVSEADFSERKLWDEYVLAHEQMLEKCSTPWAPWYVIPSDRKWYRNLVVGHVITKALEDINPQIPKPTVDISKFKAKQA